MDAPGRLIGFGLLIEFGLQALVQIPDRLLDIAFSIRKSEALGFFSV